jgi:uncharacterized protein YbaP (TraB family)
MKPKRSSLLWAIDGEALPGTSYVFGTMHVRHSCAFGQLPAVHAAIDACTTFATEIHLDEDVAISQLPFLPNDFAFSQYLSNKQYARLQHILQRAFGLNLAHFDRLHPMLLSSLLEARVLANDMPEALDKQLWLYAKQQDKVLTEIESLETQIAVLQQIPIAYQIKSLLKTIRHTARYRRQLRHMMTLYEQGDIRTLYQTTRRGSQQMRSALLYDRNVRMAARIAALAQQSTVCCAIGAAHLSGGKGVIRLLRHKKLIVKPV